MEHFQSPTAKHVTSVPLHLKLPALNFLELSEVSVNLKIVVYICCLGGDSGCCSAFDQQKKITYTCDREAK